MAVNSRAAVAPSPGDGGLTTWRSGGRPRPLGEILEALGVVGATDALFGRFEQDLGDERRIGEILVAQGLARRDQVELALTIQARNRAPSIPPSQSGHIDVPTDPSLGSEAVGARSSLEARRASSRFLRRKRTAYACGGFALALGLIVAISVASGGDWSGYGFGAIGLLALKLAGSARNDPVRGPIPEGLRVAVVISFYNEDPRAFLQCLDSVLSQTKKPDEIWAIDDGSTDQLCYRLATDVLCDREGAIVKRLENNGGKRHAQGHAFRETTCDVVVTIDSDTVLDQSAIAEGLRPFADDKVHAVAGNVRALNFRKNVLTRLIDLRYANAFLFDRAAYSSVGSVVCCCGSLSFFRTKVVLGHLDDFLSQTFLGVRVQYGDDRRLTQYALERGRVVLQDTSIAYTLVPETLGHYRRQQLRWNKSFFRESLWAIRRFGPRRWPFWISLLELAVWLIFTLSLIRTVYVGTARGAAVPWTLIGFAVVLAYARNVRYFGRPSCSTRAQILIYACAPLYTVLHVFLLTPLRVWALLTLRDPKWGTRSKVEVYGLRPGT